MAEKQTEKGTQTKTSPYSRSVSQKSNTALCGNQGSLQPGAPRSHRASRSGIKTHRVQTIQKLAMTQISEKECEPERDGRASTAALRVHSESTQ